MNNDRTALRTAAQANGWTVETDGARDRYTRDADVVVAFMQEYSAPEELAFFRLNGGPASENIADALKILSA